jgi:hypothetical protein
VSNRSLGNPEGRGEYSDDTSFVATARTARITSRLTFLTVCSVPVAIYQSKRLTFKRTALAGLPLGGVLIIRVRAENVGYEVIITKREFESSFPNVLASSSWTGRGIYDFNSLPFAIRPFIASGGTLPGGRPKSQPEASSTDRNAEQPLAAEVTAWLKGLTVQHGLPQQSRVYTSAMMNWQEAWRPSRIQRLIVLPFPRLEEPGDSEVRVELPLGTWRRNDSHFARSVHCLGFGENELCNPPPWANHGTQYLWDFLASVAQFGGGRQPRFAESSLTNRLRWKVELVAALRRASTYVVYAGMSGSIGPEFAGPSAGTLLLESWQRFVWPRLQSEPIKSIVWFSDIERDMLVTAGLSSLLSELLPGGP